MANRTLNGRTVALAALSSILLLFVGAVVKGPGNEVDAQGAAVDYFLKIEGVEGEIVADGHVGDIALESWSWGESNATTVGTGAGAGKVRMNDFHFRMRAGKASPQLFLYCAQGRIIPSATLVGTRDGREFVRWELKNVIISSFKEEGDRGTGAPMNEMRLRYTQIIVTYTVQNADGTTRKLSAGWDLAANKKV